MHYIGRLPFFQCVKIYNSKVLEISQKSLQKPACVDATGLANVDQNALQLNDFLFLNCYLN